MQRQHPGGCGRDRQLEDDVGGVHGLGGFAEIIQGVRLPRGCTQRRGRASGDRTDASGCHASNGPMSVDNHSTKKQFIIVVILTVFSIYCHFDDHTAENRLVIYMICFDFLN
jgi:hypothetical protein